jgi:hypothetical protein
LAYAAANGADVANLSFGGSGSFSNSLEDALRGAIQSGVTVVASSGNDSRDNDLLPFYPAGYDIDGLISVAASDHFDHLAYFSNFGVSTVDLAAPGEDVVGGLPPDGWGVGSGTSFAAPHVAGVAGLVEAVRPDASPAEVEDLVVGGVDSLPALSGLVRSGGRLNAFSALEAATTPVAMATASPGSGILPVTIRLDGAGSYDPFGVIVAWSWRLPDGRVVPGVETDWRPTRPGSYQATLTVVDDDGLSASAVVSFQVRLRPGGTFVDDGGHFAEGAIEAIAAESITMGCNPPVSDRFCPDDEVTRGQMAAFLARALRLPATATDFFADDAGSVFEQAIDKLAAAGITQGCNPPINDRYCPDDPVTRGQMAAFLARAFHLPLVFAFDAFVDDDGSIFEQAIDRLADAGITSGCNPPVNDRFCPAASVRRGEMAVFLARALGLPPIYPTPR